mmetsp:Transcript_21729/g.34045  ORF Transcript_21729/g.34045 Transcript_21729/m.34045 type:complete len:233 (-) Transcript_21729:277-975(-)
MYLMLLAVLALSDSFSLCNFSIATLVLRTKRSISSSSLVFRLLPFGSESSALPTARGRASSSLTRRCHRWSRSSAWSVSKRRRMISFCFERRSPSSSSTLFFTSVSSPSSRRISFDFSFENPVSSSAANSCCSLASLSSRTCLIEVSNLSCLTIREFCLARSSTSCAFRIFSFSSCNSSTLRSASRTRVSTSSESMLGPPPRILAFSCFLSSSSWSILCRSFVASLDDLSFS